MSRASDDQSSNSDSLDNTRGRNPRQLWAFPIFMGSLLLRPYSLISAQLEGKESSLPPAAVSAPGCSLCSFLGAAMLLPLAWLYHLSGGPQPFSKNVLTISTGCAVLTRMLATSPHSTHITHSYHK